METKECRGCGEQKPLSEFGRHHTPDGLRYKCKACTAIDARAYYLRTLERRREVAKIGNRRNYQKRKEYLRKWRAENPEHAHDTLLHYTYGLPSGWYAATLAQQGGSCAVCGSPDPGRNGQKKWQWFAVDHCHSTGQIRGLLCYKCNTALGHLDDDPEKMRKLIAYLLKYSPDQPKDPVDEALDSMAAPKF